MPRLRRDAFPTFPYDKPYAIQVDLMRRVYDACERSKTLGVFESPTGTGKTLSVLIGALSWVDDRRRARLNGDKLDDYQSDDDDDVKVDADTADARLDGKENKATGTVAEDDEPDWLKEYDTKRRKSNADETERRRARIREDMRHRAKTAETRARLKRDAEARLRDKIQSKATTTTTALDPHAEEEREFLADDYDSGAEHAVEDLKLLLKDDEDSDSDGFGASALEDEDEALRPAQQIILCSRTHSQLTQVIGELRGTVFGGKKTTGDEEQVAVAAVAGRAQLCVNPAVRNLGSAARINERCLDLSKNKTGARGKPKGCPYLSKRRRALLELKEAALAKPMDIEDLAKMGETRRTCPYYAARSALPEADLVLMPYASLLHADTRESLGVKLENAVVVFDEAHNLVDAVHNAYGAAVTLNQLEDVDDMLTTYVNRFKTRLSASNLRHLRTLTNITRAFTKALVKETEDTTKPEKRLLSLNDFLFECGQDVVNMFSLKRYLKESKIAHKIASYGERVRSGQALSMNPEDFKVENIGNAKVAVVGSSDASSGGTRVGAVHALASLINALAGADADGRMIYERGDGKDTPATLKFVLLDAASRFKSVVDQARSVVLVGGTLAPIPELVTQLFPDLIKNRNGDADAKKQQQERERRHQLRTFTCGHIIPKDNLLPMTVSAGPTGVSLDFTHDVRSNAAVMDELGRIVINANRVAPGGACVFFPSFKYADAVCARWEQTGALTTMRSVKDVYREPRDASALEQCLRDYAESVRRAKESGTNRGGGILLCVVGGKLSEGINFKDELGRLVIMVGLPYANVADAELKARMDHLDTGIGNQGRGRAYYEALCMRGVNQSIGRAIRHVGDYACILLCDKRWGVYGSGGSSDANKTKAANALPDWIRARLRVPEKYGHVQLALGQFFRARAEASARR